MVHLFGFVLMEGSEPMALSQAFCDLRPSPKQKILDTKMTPKADYSVPDFSARLCAWLGGPLPASGLTLVFGPTVDHNDGVKLMFPEIEPCATASVGGSR
jgi:hypothetical protein